MSQTVYSHSGVRIGVAVPPKNANLTEAQFSELSYVPISNVGAIGEYGIVTNVLSYDPADSTITGKRKGMTNPGDPTIEMARTDSDFGQQLLLVMGASDYDDAHAFAVVKQDGSIDYLRGLVVGPVSPGGRNEDFDLHKYVIALLQAPIHSPYIELTGDWILESGFWSGSGIWTPDDLWPA